jgi:malate synthase
VTRAEVEGALARMAEVVDGQNEGDPLYRPMSGNPESTGFAAAAALIFDGEVQPSGYTEPLLHAHRLQLKAGRQG